MRRTAPLGLAVLLAFSQGLAAQMSPGARSVAMGGGGMVFATGVDAVEWNPANLGWAGGWNVSLFEVGISMLTTGATIGEIVGIADEDAGTFQSSFAGWLFQTDRTSGEIIAGLPADGVQLSAVTEGFWSAFATEQSDLPALRSFSLPSVGLTVGPFGIRVRNRVFSDITISKELADLIGNGYVDQNIQNYSVGNTGWSTTSLSEVTVAYGTTLGGLLSIGVGGRYVMGHGMVQGRFFEPELDLNCIGVSGCDALTIQTVAVESTDGTGYGLDVGASLELPGGFRASVSGTNVIQKMTWEEALVAHTAEYTDADFDDSSFIDILDRFDAEPIDPNGASLGVYTAAEGLFEQSYFPQVYRAGIGWQSGGTSLEAVGSSVAPRGRYTSSWDQRVSLGIEQKIPILTLRAGYALGEDGITAVTGGLGLGFGPVLLEASGGRFSGESVSTTTWDGYYGTVALQIKGG